MRTPIGGQSARAESPCCVRAATLAEIRMYGIPGNVRLAHHEPAKSDALTTWTDTGGDTAAPARAVVGARSRCGQSARHNRCPHLSATFRQACGAIATAGC